MNDESSLFVGFGEKKLLSLNAVLISTLRALLIMVGSSSLFAISTLETCPRDFFLPFDEVLAKKLIFHPEPASVSYTHLTLPTKA